MSIRQPPNYLPTEATEPTEVSGARYSPTDCTDIHRLGGYGILPYPRSHQTIFPQKPTQPNHLCASVKSVGGSSPPEDSVYSVNSVGEPYVATKLSSPQNSRNTETTGGEYPPTDCTDVHRLGEYGIPAIPTQPTNYLPTEFTEHTETTGGEKKSVYICEDCTDVHRLGGKTQPKNLCTSVKSVGGSSTPEASVYSVKSVGEYPLPEASVNSVNSVGGLA